MFVSANVVVMCCFLVHAKLGQIEPVEACCDSSLIGRWHDRIPQILFCEARGVDVK